MDGVFRPLGHLAGGVQICVNECLQRGPHFLGHGRLLFRGQLGKYAVLVRLFGGLGCRGLHGLFLFRLPLLLKLGKMAVNGGYQLMGGGPYGFQGGFQLFQIPAGTPPGRNSTRPHSQRNSPTCPGRSAGRRYRPRSRPVPHGCGCRAGRWLGPPGQWRAAWNGRSHGWPSLGSVIRSYLPEWQSAFPSGGSSRGNRPECPQSRWERGKSVPAP